MIFFIPLMALLSQLIHESIAQRLDDRKPQPVQSQSAPAQPDDRAQG